MSDNGLSIKSYVTRNGRVTKAQQRAFNALGGKYCIPFSDSPLDFYTVFNNYNPVTIEIGFGMGSATAEIAAAHPQKNYIGVEVFRAGIGRLLWEIENRGLANVRIIEHDAVPVLEKMIPGGSLEAAHIFFPDPWPKTKHHKRRLVKRPFTNLLASKLMDGGYIYMVSDCDDYCNFALSELSETQNLMNNHEKFAAGQDWRPVTKFEKKGLARGSAIKELFFHKTESPDKPD
ncbi:MAG: tRNA (guanosine(46)-N7)-methyltransferase TrmB [Spirochaetaceae bacterium]|jgi:tRNA (guanine-N7-)-methyltransferase|nr:tRNA (guanosine(46)-N7)-methyltransferase TrmB [Spirochaetaceae bacterium]